MKKIIFISILTIFSFIVNAQDSTSKGLDMSFGLKGGLNFSLITGDGTDNLDGKVSFHIGAVSEIPISDRFSFQPELLYSSQGDKENSDGMEIKYKMDYLNVPLMAKYYISEGFSLEAGPQIGFLLSSKLEGDGISIDMKNLFKKVDFAIGFGLGYKLDNGLNFSGRYNVGLSNIVKSNGTILGEEMDTNNSKNQNEVFQISIGYFF